MSNRIKLRQLKAYQAIVVSGSVSGAAERLHITQPAVSRQLAALEKEIGLRLFDRRSGGPMIPTPSGIKFYQSIESTLTGVDNIMEIAQEISRFDRVRIQIAATPPLINSNFFVNALADYKSTNENIWFILESQHRLNIEEWVITQQVDFGFAILPVNNPLIFAKPLVQTRAVAVLHKDHPLASKSGLSPDDLKGQSLILPSRQPLRISIDQMLSQAGIRCPVSIESASLLCCCKFASHNFGIAISDPFSPTIFGDSDLRVLPWEPEIPLTYGALFARDRINHKETVVNQIIDCIRDSAERSNLTHPLI